VATEIRGSTAARQQSGAKKQACYGILGKQDVCHPAVIKRLVIYSCNIIARPYACHIICTRARAQASLPHRAYTNRHVPVATGPIAAIPSFSFRLFEDFVRHVLESCVTQQCKEHKSVIPHSISDAPRHSTQLTTKGSGLFASMVYT
jgi:hypothetical protein